MGSDLLGEREFPLVHVLFEVVHRRLELFSLRFFEGKHHLPSARVALRLLHLLAELILLRFSCLTVRGLERTGMIEEVVGLGNNQAGTHLTDPINESFCLPR